MTSGNFELMRLAKVRSVLTSPLLIRNRAETPRRLFSTSTSCSIQPVSRPLQDQPPPVCPQFDFPVHQPKPAEPAIRAFSDIPRRPLRSMLTKHRLESIRRTHAHVSSRFNRRFPPRASPRTTSATTDSPPVQSTQSTIATLPNHSDRRWRLHSGGLCSLSRRKWSLGKPLHPADAAALRASQKTHQFPA